MLTSKKLPTSFKIHHFAIKQVEKYFVDRSQDYIDYSNILIKINAIPGVLVSSPALEFYESTCSWFDTVNSYESGTTKNVLNYEFFRINVYPELQKLYIVLSECTPEDKTILFKEILYRVHSKGLPANYVNKIIELYKKTW